MSEGEERESINTLNEDSWVLVTQHNTSSDLVACLSVCLYLPLSVCLDTHHHSLSIAVDVHAREQLVQLRFVEVELEERDCILELIHSDGAVSCAVHLCEGV